MKLKSILFFAFATIFYGAFTIFYNCRRFQPTDYDAKTISALATYKC